MDGRSVLAAPVGDITAAIRGSGDATASASFVDVVVDGASGLGMLEGIEDGDAAVAHDVDGGSDTSPFVHRGVMYATPGQIVLVLPVHR